MGNVAKQFDEIARRVKALGMVYSPLYKTFDLTEIEIVILRELLLREEGCTQAELCDVWLFNRKTVHSTIKSMEKEGLVELRYAPGNRKNKLVTLTEAGKRLAERAVAPIFAAERAVIEELGEDLPQYLSLLDRQADAFREALGEQLALLS